MEDPRKALFGNQDLVPSGNEKPSKRRWSKVAIKVFAIILLIVIEEVVRITILAPAIEKATAVLSHKLPPSVWLGMLAGSAILLIRARLK